MARARMLSASISNSARFGSLASDGARMLYLMLIPHADNLGRLRGEPVQIKGLVLPRHQSKPEIVDKWLEDIAMSGLIRWYLWQDQRFIEIDKFMEFNGRYGNMRQKSDLPGPDDEGSSDYVGRYTEKNSGEQPETEKDSVAYRHGLRHGHGVGHGDHRPLVDDVRVLREWLEAFDQHFWPAYPRKVSKAEALGAWRKLFTPGKGMPEHEALLGRIVGGLGWYCDDEWRDRAQDKIPHAATWLNQKRWEDAFDGTQAESAAE